MIETFPCQQLQQICKLFEQPQHNSDVFVMPTFDTGELDSNLVQISSSELYTSWLWALYNRILTLNNAFDTLKTSMGLAFNSSSDPDTLKNSMLLMGSRSYSDAVNSIGRYCSHIKTSPLRQEYLCAGQFKLKESLSMITDRYMDELAPCVRRLEYFTVGGKRYCLIIEWDVMRSELPRIYIMDNTGWTCIQREYYRPTGSYYSCNRTLSNDPFMFTQTAEYKTQRSVTARDVYAYYKYRLLWTLAQYLPIGANDYCHATLSDMLPDLKRPFGKSLAEIKEDLKKLISIQLDNVVKLVADIQAAISLS